MLYQTLQAHWRTFLLDLVSEGDSADAFGDRRVRGGGIPSVPNPRPRLRPGEVPRPLERAVGFSVSAADIARVARRRMCDFAAALAERVVPRVPVRQWVLTVPHGVRGKTASTPA